MDPLADTVPPRHAIESDEEDELNPLHATEQPIPSLDIKVLGQIPMGRNLVIATGDAGGFWATGVDLGEQTGAVAVNGVQIGLVFNPFWTKANVIVSEALSRLPVWAMQPYAQKTIDALQPTSVSMLDEYSVPSYITNTPIPASEAPIRYLSTSVFDPAGQAQTFDPPNLINGTSSSFLSILTISKILGTLLLLPSPNILKPAPNTIEPGNITRLEQDVVGWPATVMNQAQQLLFRAINEPVNEQWEPKDSISTFTRSPPKRPSQIGEGGMFI